MGIHPTAIIDPAATVGDGVEIGPYAIIGAGVVLGAGCRIAAHACLRGPLEMGPDCVVEEHAVLGGDPHVTGNPGPFGGTRIGARCVFREFVTVHRSMYPDKLTVVGDDGFFMEGSHIAHDCIVGEAVTIADTSKLGGHVEVGRRAFISALSAVQQFGRVGEIAMVGGRTSVQRDVPPFTMVSGDRPRRLDGLNTVGLRRAGVEPRVRVALKAAFRTLFRSDATIPERLAAVDTSVPEVSRLVEFVQSTQRGIIGFSFESDE